jgi:hypothetical protein
LPIPVILTDKLTKEILKILHFGKSRTTTYCVGLPQRRFSWLAFRMYSDEHKILGNHFDIHGGGMDLKFPHHECEITK